MHDDEPDPTRREARGFLWLALGVELGLGAVALCLGAARSGIRFDMMAAVTGIGLSAPMLAGLLLVLTLPWTPLRRLRDDSVRLIGPLFRHAGPVLLVSIAAAAGFGEELLFRGVLQPLAVVGLAKLMPAEWSLWVGIAFVSLVFAAFHGLSRSYFVLAFVVSVYLGWSVILTGNLLPAMLAHGLYDLVALAYLVRRERGPRFRNLLGARKIDV